MAECWQPHLIYPCAPHTARCSIARRKGSWFLDHGRSHPVLKVTRRQIPLASAFAITAHAAQGQTLKAAIVDLQIRRGTSPIAAYVALTRIIHARPARRPGVVIEDVAWRVRRLGSGGGNAHAVYFLHWMWFCSATMNSFCPSGTTKMRTISATSA